VIGGVGLVCVMGEASYFGWLVKSGTIFEGKQPYREGNDCKC